MPNHMPLTKKVCKESFRINPRHSLPAKNVAMAIEEAGYSPKPTKKQNCNMAFKHKIHLPLPHYTSDEKDCGNNFDDGVNHSTDELHDMASAADIKGHTKMNRSNLCRSLIKAGIDVSVGGRPAKKDEAEAEAEAEAEVAAVERPPLFRRPAMIGRLLNEDEENEGRRKRNSKRRPKSKSACKNRSMTWVKRHKSKSHGKKVMVRGSCRKKSNRA
jgi:hypothetical protein